MLSETVTEYEVLTGSGVRVVATADNEHAELFRALPLSHGTLGLLVSLKVRVVPAKQWVRLRYTPFTSKRAFCSAYQDLLETARVSPADAPFFAESIVFRPEQAVLMRG